MERLDIQYISPEVVVIEIAIACVTLATSTGTGAGGSDGGWEDDD